jgi:hypothetical protein
MFVHVVAEVLEQGDLLGEGLWEHLQRVEELGAIAIYVLHISAAHKSNINSYQNLIHMVLPVNGNHVPSMDGYGNQLVLQW